MDKRVLFVEDDQSNFNTVSDIIHFIFPNWKIEPATTRQEAVDKAMQLLPDLIILDIALADGRTGLAVVQDIARSSILKKPKIILVTALANESVPGLRSDRWLNQLSIEERALVSDFFEKPFNTRQFMRSIASALNIADSNSLQTIESIPDL